MKKFLAYLRTSTDKKSQSGPDQQGYSFDAQMHAIARYVESVGGEIIGTYSEQMSGSDNERPEMLKCFAKAKAVGASVCISKLDRISRDAAFIIALSKNSHGVEFKIAENPSADFLQIALLAVIADNERQAIASRVRQSMAAAKRAGVKFGNPNPDIAAMNRGATEAAVKFKNQIRPVIEEIKAVAGIKSFSGIAKVLNVRGIKTRTGKNWFPQSVKMAMAA